MLKDEEVNCVKITDQMMDEALVDIRQLLDSCRDETGAYCLEHFIAMVALDFARSEIKRAIEYGGDLGI